MAPANSSASLRDIIDHFAPGDLRAARLNRSRYEAGEIWLTAPVGNRRNAGVRNRPQDVYAVQVALRTIHETFPQQRKLTGHLPDGTEVFAQFPVDPGPATGTINGQTIRAIKNMQRWFLRRTKRPNGIFKSPPVPIPNLDTWKTYSHGEQKPSTYTFACMCRLLKATYGGGTAASPGWGAAALVRLMQSKMGQPFMLGACVPKYMQEWMGPWDCTEFVAWGLYQMLRGRFSHLLPKGAILGTTSRQNLKRNRPETRVPSGNGVLYSNAGVHMFDQHLRRLERDATAPVQRIPRPNRARNETPAQRAERLRKEAERFRILRTTPGLIGVHINGMYHVLMTDGAGGTVEAGYGQYGPAIGSRRISKYIYDNYNFWKINCLYQPQGQIEPRDFYKEG